MLAGIGLTPWFPTTQGQRFAGALDVAPGAAAAYSLRKLRAAYSGAAIRVRESGGNTEAYIGFDASGDLDTSALLAHTGSNDGFVVAWYDQSGNGNDAFEFTFADQPQIVDAGSVMTRLGKPAIDSSNAGSDGGLYVTLASPIDDKTIFAVSDQPSSGEKATLELYDSSNSSRHLLRGTSTNDHDYVVVKGAVLDFNRIADDLTGSNLFYLNHIGTALETIVNNTALVSHSTPDTDASDSLVLLNDSGGGNAGAVVSEVIIYDSDQSGNRADIASNINAHYGVY